MPSQSKVALSAALLALCGGVVGLVHPTTPAVAGTGTPTFESYAAPTNMPNAGNSGEPSIGINHTSGNVMYQAYSSTYKVAFNDATTPATVTWTNATAPTNRANIDPILATDAVTGRTWGGGLAGPCSFIAFTDTDGASWSQSANPCSGAADHETIGSGPWHGTAPVGATYSRAVYYCAQDPVDACSTSTDGGQSFRQPVTVGSPCNWLHGHVKVSADGTAYVPNDHCGGKVGGAVSTNNGGNWSSYQITPSTESSRGFDPSVATTPDNTVWEAWAEGGNNHPMIAKSTNHGGSWTGVTDLASTITPSAVASTFQAVVAGDNGRVAVAWLGTTVGSGSPYTNGYHGVWNLYVSYTYDNGTNWTTVKATADPVQRGCIWDGGGSNVCRNLLDFMGADLTTDGRVVVGYADGCTGTCAGGSGTEAQSTSSWATITRQSTGKGLYSAYDSSGGNVLPTSCFTHSESSLTTSVDGSCSTDSDGTISSYAWSWGDASANGSGATASHTYGTAGTYTVQLTVTDNSGGTAFVTHSVTVSGGGGGDPDPSTPNLSNGAVEAGTSAGTGAWKYYKINVPSGQSSFVVTLSSGQACVPSCLNNLDLYLRTGAKPTLTTYNCAQTANNISTETCTVSAPAATWWYIGVYQQSGSLTQSFSLQANYS